MYLERVELLLCELPERRNFSLAEQLFQRMRYLSETRNEAAIQVS
jgi:hypothetical protein